MRGFLFRPCSRFQFGASRHDWDFCIVGHAGHARAERLPAARRGDYVFASVQVVGILATIRNAGVRAGIAAVAITLQMIVLTLVQSAKPGLAGSLTPASLAITSILFFLLAMVGALLLQLAASPFDRTRSGGETTRPRTGRSALMAIAYAVAFAAPTFVLYWVLGADVASSGSEIMDVSHGRITAHGYLASLTWAVPAAVAGFVANLIPFRTVENAANE